MRNKINDIIIIILCLKIFVSYDVRAIVYLNNEVYDKQRNLNNASI